MVTLFAELNMFTQIPIEAIEYSKWQNTFHVLPLLARLQHVATPLQLNMGENRIHPQLNFSL